MVSITRCQALCAGLIALPIVISSAASAQQLSSESVRPTTQAVALTAVPTIDGEVLGDAAWAGIKPTSGFTKVRPNEGQAATQNTEVFVGFSDDTL